MQLAAIGVYRTANINRERERDGSTACHSRLPASLYNRPIHLQAQIQPAWCTQFSPLYDTTNAAYLVPQVAVPAPPLLIRSKFFFLNTKKGRSNIGCFARNATRPFSLADLLVERSRVIGSRQSQITAATRRPIAPLKERGQGPRMTYMVSSRAQLWPAWSPPLFAFGSTQPLYESARG